MSTRPPALPSPLRPAPPDPTGADQESVWRFPRPARAESCAHRLQVIFSGVVIADTSNGYRVIETSHPPSYYFPPEDVDRLWLVPAAKRTMCEWKGGAAYFDVVGNGRHSPDAAWSYPDPVPAFRVIANFLAFHPRRVDACLVGGERAEPQESDFYGGWITSHVTGPFKGPPGTEHW